MAGGIQDLHFIESVTERDLDLLMLEELQVSHEFRDWFAARVYDEPIYKSLINTWHSLTNEHGESDITFVFTAEDETTTAILIENKINARAQPDQGERYHRRGKKGVSDGDWTQYRTCLIAPRRYLKTQAEEYDCEVAYEEIMAYFVARRSTEPRHDYRAKFIMDGVGQQRRGYQSKEPNEGMTSFVRQYWQLVQDRYPELRMSEPKPRPAGNTWINFYPSTFPKSIDLVHQVTGGFVKVLFNGRAPEFEAIEARYRDMASTFPELRIQLAGKSVSIAVPVEPLAPLQQSFNASRGNVEAALDTAYRLAREIPSRGFPT